MDVGHRGGHVMVAIFGAFAACFTWYGVVVLEPFVLQNLIAPAAGMDIQDWLDEFQRGQVFVVACATFLSLIWHGIAYLNSGRHGDGRILWVVLLVTGVVMSLALCAWLLPDTQEGVEWAYVVAFVNGFAPFWLGTVWCTPAGGKYAPIGAQFMRGLFKQQ